MFPNQLENLCCCTTRIRTLLLWVYPAHCSESTDEIVKSPALLSWVSGEQKGKTSGLSANIDVQVCENMHRVLKLSRIKHPSTQVCSLPPWFLCNMRTEWLAALWPWCQTGGRGTASSGPGCTSGAPRNTCAHPSSRGALLIKHTHGSQSGHSQGWVVIQ